MKIRKILTSVAAAIMLSAAPALADTAIGTGVFLPSGGSNALGILASYNLIGIPATPIKLQLTAGIPLGPGGRYVTVLEGEYESRRFFGGVGGGGGKMTASGTSNAMYDLFAGVRVLPLISLQARYFGTGNSNSGSALYLGASFGFR